MPGSVFSRNIHWAEREVPGTAELEEDGGPGPCQGCDTLLRGVTQPQNLPPAPQAAASLIGDPLLEPYLLKHKMLE